MAYGCQNFQNGDVLSAEHLNCIEEGIVELESAMSKIQEAVGEDGGQPTGIFLKLSDMQQLKQN